MDRRHKGEGRLFVRGGTWYMRWRCNGRECTRTTGVLVDEQNAKAKAEKALREATEILRLQDKVSRLEVVKRMLETTNEEIRERTAGIRRGATLGDLDGLFRKSAYRIDCSAAQLETYSRYIHNLCDAIGETTKVADIDAAIAEAFARHLAQGRSPNTYNKYLNGLELVWKSVLPVIGGVFNPWSALPRRRLDTSVRRALSDVDIERVFATAQGEIKTLFTIGLYTGLRMGDAVSLRFEDIRGGVVYVKTAKTGAKVAIPVHRRIVECIGDVAGRRGYICPSLHETYVVNGKSSISARFRRLFGSCGIETSVDTGTGNARPVCGFHSLRHTFVSRCAEAGIDRAIVQALVGHSSAKMTEHYTHLSDRAFQEAFAKLA